MGNDEKCLSLNTGGSAGAKSRSYHTIFAREDASSLYEQTLKRTKDVSLKPRPMLSLWKSSVSSKSFSRNVILMNDEISCRLRNEL